MTGPPQPPTLSLPEPVRNLTAERVGSAVRLHWTMPRHTTDKVELKGNQRAHICWTSAAAAPMSGHAATGALPGCRSAGDADFAPDKPAAFTATLPADLLRGPAAGALVGPNTGRRAVSYFVELENAGGKTAGPSNAAWVATGAAPPAATGLRLETRADGVALHWDVAAAEPGMTMRIERTLVAAPGAKRPSEQNGAPPAAQQTLEVDLSGRDAGGAVDRDAATDHVWRYQVERVLRVKAEGKALEIEGEPSAEVTIDAKDVFPPAVPAGLAVVVDEQARAVDLSWMPDTDVDLAGYVVYRRDVTAGTAAERISGKAPVVAPAFEDRKVTAGHRYAYSVSAVDADGNESARSGEVVEGLAE